MIRIALLDDHKLFRSGMIALLRNDDALQVVSQSENGQQFIESLEANPVDVVLMDLEMPVMNGMECTEKLKQSHPEVKVIVLSMHNDDKFIVHLMEIGARGYLLKNAEPEEIFTAIHSVAETGYYFSPMVSRVMLEGLVKKEKVKPRFSETVELSERELDVVRLICQERTTDEIAEALFISNRTVDGHRARIMEKTGARNTAGIVVYALKNGLVE